MRRYIFLFALIGLSWACQEEDLKPGEEINSFLPDENATDATSQLRREFYEATGCFLLFNDTLRHEYIGDNADGSPLYETELVELSWMPLESNTSLEFGYEYITDSEKQQDIYDFLVNNLYPYMKAAMPYSILAVNSITQYDEDYDGEIIETSLSSYSNSRCTALSFAGLWESDDWNAYAQDFCCELILVGFGGDPTWYYDGGKAEAFFAVNKWDYGERKSDSDYGIVNTDRWTGTEEEYMAQLYELGFIEDADNAYLPEAKEDGIAFIKACLSMTDEEFRAKFGAYEIVMEKYEIMKPLVDATGIKFE